MLAALRATYSANAHVRAAKAAAKYPGKAAARTAAAIVSKAKQAAAVQARAQVAAAAEAKYPGKAAAKAAARAARTKPKAGGSRPRIAKLKINNSSLLMPFHDITDDPYFIRVLRYC